MTHTPHTWTTNDVITAALLNTLETDLAAAAALASPIFTGSPSKAGVPLATTADITAAISALVAGAPGAMDTLKEISDQLGADESAAAALTTLLTQRTISAAPVTLTAAGTLTANVSNLLDATTAPFTAMLPTPTRIGQLLVVERADTGLNLITIGGTVRGVTNNSPTMPGLGTAGESITFAAESLTSWRPIASHKPKALLDKQYDALGTAAIKGPMPVGNRTWITTGPYWTTNQPGTSKSSHYATDDITDLQMGWANWGGNTTSGGNGGDVDNTNVSPLPIRAAVEYPAGVVTPVFFNGSRTGSLDNGGTIFNDPVGIDIPKGAQFWVRTYLNPATGDRWPQVGNSTGGSEGEGFISGDLTAAGAAAITASGSYLFRPVVIRGRSTARRSIAIVGDSIAAGQGDTSTTAATPNRGFIARALGAANLPWVAITVPGEVAAIIAAGNHARRFPLMDGCTSAICEYGINDLQTGLSPTLGGLANNLIKIWRAISARGLKTWQTTITPTSSSTDSWATLGGQTVDTGRNNSVRIAFNAWIRAGAPIDATALTYVATGTAGALLAGQPGHPLTGYFDAADAVESARDSGLWKVTGAANGYTVDGTHPSPAGHALLATAITTAFLS